MAQFTWTGRDAQHALQTGVLEAASASQVADTLVSMALVPVLIQPYTPPSDAGATLTRLWRREHVDTDSLMIFSRQMHTLLRAGVPILRALTGLASSTDNRTLADLLKNLRTGLDAGHELSQVMARHSSVFDDFYVAMVRVGEQTGRLADIFKSLYAHLEFQQFIAEQVKSALRYPKFVVLAMVAALVVMNIFVIPQFARVFANFKADLPLMTRILLGTSRAAVEHWPAMLGACAAAWLAMRAWMASSAGALLWDRAKLRLPIAGKILHKSALARACGSLALVQRSGVPLIQGLSLAAEVTDNRFMRERILGMRQAVERGDSVLSAAAKADIFTPLVLQMIMVGEEAGTLDEMLEEISQLYRRDVEQDLKTMSQQIEPLLIFVLGGMVLVLALGVFMPMWELGSVANK